MGDRALSDDGVGCLESLKATHVFFRCGVRYLLFLRHVQRIEVYNVGEGDSAPVLHYSVEVTKRDPAEGWQSVPNFVSGPPRRMISKEAFFTKLSQTPDSSLPKVEQLVTITFREEANKPRGIGGDDVGGEAGGAAVPGGQGDEGGDGAGDANAGKGASSCETLSFAAKVQRGEP